MKKRSRLKKLEESVAFLADRFIAFLASQSGNKILYDYSGDDGNGQSEGIVKGIELKPEINNKAVGKITSSTSTSSSNISNNNNNNK